jgi:hypothetical protein
MSGGFLDCRAPRRPAAGESANRCDMATHLRRILPRVAPQRQAKNSMDEHSKNSRLAFDQILLQSRFHRGQSVARGPGRIDGWDFLTKK